MYCKNCGKQIQTGEICKDCESILNTSVVTDDEGFEVVQQVYGSNSNSYNQNTNSNKNNTSYNNVTSNSSSQSQKSKIAAGLFGIFLGAFGVHNFYLGYTGKAIAQLLITILSCGTLSFASVIWGLIEGILILAGEIKDSNGNELKD